LGKSIISNANIKVVGYQDLGGVGFSYSFTLFVDRTINESEKKFFKQFFKYMTKKYGPANNRWSYSRGASGYFNLRFRDYKDAVQFKILI
jgi:hypothetical protein|tara:strand:+ start:190 stop:459 length:270 start_codon:yes stop_codon:yes gene_type:complete